MRQGLGEDNIPEPRDDEPQHPRHKKLWTLIRDKKMIQGLQVWGLESLPAGRVLAGRMKAWQMQLDDSLWGRE